MERVNSIQEYKSLIKHTKERVGKIDTNCVLMSNVMEQYIKEERLFFRSFPMGIALYVDEGTYYELYFFWSREAPFAEFHASKPVAIVIITTLEKNDEHLIQLETKIQSGGFKFFKTSLQLDVNLDQLDYSLEKELKQRQETLSSQGFSLKYCDTYLFSQVKALWTEHLDLTDVPFDHYKNNKNDCILCAVDQNDYVAAAQWWRSEKNNLEGRHTVTHPNYYRRGLGTTLLLAQFQFSKQNGILKNKTWVKDTNYQSLAMHKKVGFKPNGRISKQFIIQ